MKKILIVLMSIALASSMASCKSNQSASGDDAAGTSQKGAGMAASNRWVEPKSADIDPAKKYTAVIRTSKGVITAELYPNEAPLSVTNFKYLSDGGFYKGLTFHRVVPGFVVQGGDPTATGSGGPGYTMPSEIKMPHKKGALAWARTGDAVNPERRSSGSQFYITLEATPFLDGQYTVFGQTISGMDVVEKIEPGDKIESVEVKAE